MMEGFPADMTEDDVSKTSMRFRFTYQIQVWVQVVDH